MSVSQEITTSSVSHGGEPNSNVSNVCEPQVPSKVVSKDTMMHTVKASDDDDAKDEFEEPKRELETNKAQQVTSQETTNETELSTEIEAPTGTTTANDASMAATCTAAIKTEAAMVTDRTNPVDNIDNLIRTINDTELTKKTKLQPLPKPPSKSESQSQSRPQPQMPSQVEPMPQAETQVQPQASDHDSSFEEKNDDLFQPTLNDLGDNKSELTRMLEAIRIRLDTQNDRIKGLASELRDYKEQNLQLLSIINELNEKMGDNQSHSHSHSNDRENSIPSIRSGHTGSAHTGSVHSMERRKTGNNDNGNDNDGSRQAMGHGMGMGNGMVIDTPKSNTKSISMTMTNETLKKTNDLIHKVAKSIDNIIVNAYLDHDGCSDAYTAVAMGTDDQDSDKKMVSGHIGNGSYSGSNLDVINATINNSVIVKTTVKTVGNVASIILPNRAQMFIKQQWKNFNA